MNKLINKFLNYFLRQPITNISRNTFGKTNHENREKFYA